MNQAIINATEKGDFEAVRTLIENGKEIEATYDLADQNELKVYPNPAKNELWIKFNYRGNDNPVIVLQNLKGHTLKQIPVNETGSLLKRMATHNLASGIYLLTVQGEEVFPVKRVMIEN